MNIHVEGHWSQYAFGLLLLVMVLSWFYMLTRLFKRLEKTHPQKYEQMGKPSLFLNNSLKTNWTTLRFLAAREHKALHDPQLTRLSDFMLIFLCTYLLLFFGTAFFITQLQSHAV